MTFISVLNKYLHLDSLKVRNIPGVVFWKLSLKVFSILSNCPNNRNWEILLVCCAHSAKRTFLRHPDPSRAHIVQIFNSLWQLKYDKTWDDFQNTSPDLLDCLKGRRTHCTLHSLTTGSSPEARHDAGKAKHFNRCYQTIGPEFPHARFKWM